MLVKFIPDSLDTLAQLINIDYLHFVHLLVTYFQRKVGQVPGPPLLFFRSERVWTETTSEQPTGQCEEEGFKVSWFQGLVFSDGADTTSLGRLFHRVKTRKEKNVNLACERQ